VDNGVGPECVDERQDAGAVAHVQLVVREAGQRRLEAALVPPRVAGRAKKNRPLVVVDAVNGVSVRREICADFRADQAGRAGDEEVARRWHRVEE